MFIKPSWWSPYPLVPLRIRKQLSGGVRELCSENRTIARILIFIRIIEGGLNFKTGSSDKQFIWLLTCRTDERCLKPKTNRLQYQKRLQVPCWLEDKRLFCHPRPFMSIKSFLILITNLIENEKRIIISLERIQRSALSILMSDQSFLASLVLTSWDRIFDLKPAIKGLLCISRFLYFHNISRGEVSAILSIFLNLDRLLSIFVHLVRLLFTLLECIKRPPWGIVRSHRKYSTKWIFCYFIWPCAALSEVNIRPGSNFRRWKPPRARVWYISLLDHSSPLSSKALHLHSPTAHQRLTQTATSDLATRGTLSRRTLPHLRILSRSRVICLRRYGTGGNSDFRLQSRGMDTVCVETFIDDACDISEAWEGLFGGDDVHGSECFLLIKAPYV